MSIGVKNIEQTASFDFSSKIESRVIVERLFTSLLGYGKIVMLLLDLALLNICLCITGLLLMGMDLTFSETYLSGMVYFSVLWIFLSYLRGIHKNLLLIDTVEIFQTLAKVFFVFVVCSWFFILILLDGFKNIDLFVYFICMFYLLYGAALAGNRILLLSIRKHFKDKIRKKKNVFIIGDSSSCELLESYIEENQCDLRLCGFFYDGFNQPSDLEQFAAEVGKGVSVSKVIGEPISLGSHIENMNSKQTETVEEMIGEIPAVGAEFRVYQGAGSSPVKKRNDLANWPPASVPDSVSNGTTNKDINASTINSILKGQLKPVAKAAFNTSAWSKVIRGRIMDCVKYFGKMPIDEIYCSMQSMEEKTVRLLIKEADNHMIRIKFLPDFYQILRRRSTIHYMGTVPVLSIRQEPLTVDSNIIIKRVFDFCFSVLVVILILSWLAPIIGLLIKLESKGPVFFKQERSGINNKPFKVYKFRSMRTVKGIGEDRQAVKDDVRLTKLGAFLRRTSLDELPQFFNVLLGNMTVVGPRPHMVSHTDKFSKEVDAYMVRHFAKPGITGWAQVNGCRGETKTREAIEERVLHDVWYIENWSLMLDLKIIFLTVWNILRGEENAY